MLVSAAEELSPKESFQFDREVVVSDERRHTLMNKKRVSNPVGMLLRGPEGNLLFGRDVFKRDRSSPVGMLLRGSKGNLLFGRDVHKRERSSPVGMLLRGSKGNLLFGRDVHKRRVSSPVGMLLRGSKGNLLFGRQLVHESKRSNTSRNKMLRDFFSDSLHASSSDGIEKERLSALKRRASPVGMLLRGPDGNLLFGRDVDQTIKRNATKE